ncbi:hypothetical protein [Nocardia sp. NPDC004722]
MPESLPDDQPFTVTLIDDEDAWIARHPDAGEIRVTEPRGVAYSLYELIPQGHKPDMGAVMDANFVDGDGHEVYPFALHFSEYWEPDGVRDQIRADPPIGCRWLEGDQYPGLYCVRPGADFLDAVAGVIAECRARYPGLTTELNDLGVEKLWEWVPNGYKGETLISQLLLMAIHRARLLGIPGDRVVDFVRRAT